MFYESAHRISPFDFLEKKTFDKISHDRMMNKLKASKTLGILSKTRKQAKRDNGDYFKSGLWPHCLVSVKWGFIRSLYWTPLL